MSEKTHVMNLLYSCGYDFPLRDEDPAQQLMVATIPRSGSTFFCIELWRTKVLGSPLEYPNVAAAKSMINRLKGHDDFERYWKDVKRIRTGLNGVFSYKMFMTNYLDIGRKWPGLLEKLAPEKVIFLTREDKLAQAISYSKAIQSRAWFANVTYSNTPEFSQRHIAHCRHLIDKQERFWEGMFSLTGAQVFRTTYEQFLKDRPTVLQQICEFVGQPYDPDDYMLLPSLSIQRDDVSTEWAQRYRATLGTMSGHDSPIARIPTGESAFL